MSGLVGAGCSSGGTSSVTTPTSTTTSSNVTTALTNGSVYARPGNFSVGVTTLRLPTGNAVEVWYPANGGVGVGSDTYDVRSFLPAAVSRRLNPKLHTFVRTIANRDAPVGAPGEQFPLVVFSHGYGGFREESTFLTTWLASWGMVVAAPDHPSRDLARVLAPSSGIASSDVSDLRAAIDLMRTENARIGGPFKDRIILGRVAAVGYDAGASAAMALALDSRVDAYVMLARRGSLPPSGLPRKPSLLVAGAADRVAPPADSAAAFSAAPAPSYEWLLAGAGHNAFDDLCVVASDQGGLVTFAEQSRIGGLFPASFRQVVSDGCALPDLAVVKTWPVIDQVVTAFLRRFIGPDRVPVEVGPSGTRLVDQVKVTVSARPPG